METNDKQKLREFIRQTLAGHNDRDGFADGDSLFLSGRLDSMSMANLIFYLEEEQHLNFIDFDMYIELIDSVKAIEGLVDGKVIAQSHSRVTSNLRQVNS